MFPKQTVQFLLIWTTSNLNAKYILFLYLSTGVFIPLFPMALMLQLSVFSHLLSLDPEKSSSQNYIFPCEKSELSEELFTWMYLVTCLLKHTNLCMTFTYWSNCNDPTKTKKK